MSYQITRAEILEMVESVALGGFRMVSLVKSVAVAAVILSSFLRCNFLPRCLESNPHRKTRTAPKRLDEILPLDPEPPRAQADVLGLPFEELTGDLELRSTFQVGYRLSLYPTQFR
jgi:hypothetical protein